MRPKKGSSVVMSNSTTSDQIETVTETATASFCPYFCLCLFPVDQVLLAQLFETAQSLLPGHFDFFE
jgi:hypothetical protein